MTRGEEAAQEASARRQLETAKQIVAALGTMKGAAMKLGQVMSFLDVGLVPEEHREEFQRELAKLRDAAPTVSFKQMRHVIEEDLEAKVSRGVRRVRRGADRRRLDRSGVPSDLRTTPRRGQVRHCGGQEVVRSPSRSNIRASPVRSGPTYRTWT